MGIELFPVYKDQERRGGRTNERSYEVGWKTSLYVEQEKCTDIESGEMKVCRKIKFFRGCRGDRSRSLNKVQD